MELVTGAIGSLLPKLGELLKEEYGLQKGVKKKIQSLSQELRVVHAVLRKIGDVPPDQLDEQVRLWASEVREASYDMEDIIDAFLVHVDGGPDPTEKNMLGRLLKKVGKLIQNIKDRRKISVLIDGINEKLEEVAARRSRYTLDSIVANPVAATTIDPRILSLYKRTTELVGIEGPRDELINKLSLGDDVDASDNMKILSIVGFGGLGKTTLAKAVYDHFKPQFKRRASVPVDQNPDMNKATDDQLKPLFQCGAVVLVGRNPDMKKVFRDILIGLDEEKYTYSKLKGLDENQLMGKLNEFTKEKRCFIVIDDIWDKKSWELIRCAMREINFGSRLIITTRNDEVAAHAGEAYKIQPLSSDNSKRLLYARIVDGEGKFFNSPSAKASACAKILKKCGGVPLAIITIASLLASKPGEDWSEVYNSIGFGHEDNDDVGNTRRILSFSYYDMSSHLKACLLYLSIFPEDHVIEKNSLIWKWIAEGFITKEQAAVGVGLFDLGERYFNELINKNMIQPKETKHEGYIDACSVHDMILDMIHSLLSNENFVTVLDGDERQKLLGGIARRLALQRVQEHSIVQLANSTVEKVRSLIASQCGFGALCPHLPFLRVLDMVSCHVEENCNEGMLDHLGSLHHLRYLGLAYTHITELPREVRYLKFLQTLDLWESGIKELPEEVGFLTQLVCLRTDRKTRAPTGLISKLTSLQELWIWPPRAALGDDDNDYDDDDNAKMQFVMELGLLRELRVLRTNIMVTSESIERALLESLGHLCNIRDLHVGASLVYKGQTSNAEVLSYRHLRYLRLECLLFSELPAWIKSSLVPNLSYLHVQVVVVKEQDMETLARLPELRCLKLHSHDTKLVSIKIHTDGVGYFPKLRFLRISGTYIWFDLLGSKCNINSLSTIMPSLESLEFAVHVRSLKDLMTQLGLEKLLGIENLGRSSLKRITTIVCCGGSHTLEVEEVETALVHVAEVHPKHPTLQITRRAEEDMLSPYQEAFMDGSRTPELVNKAWKLSNIISSGHIRALHIPGPAASSSKVICLLFLSCRNGRGLLALSSNAVHKLWKWERSDKNPCGESTTTVPPQLWRPGYGIGMKNDTTNANPKDDTACIALCNHRSFLISTSGGKVSLFNVTTFEIMTTFMAPPPSPTFLAFNPLDNSIIAIGMEDSSIYIYNVRTTEVKMVLRGHQKKITGLTFSQSLNVLVSSGADAQLCVWSMDSWEKMKSRYIQPPSDGSEVLLGDTMVQFHYDQKCLLVVHDSRLAIYDWTLGCLCSWFPSDALPAPVSCAVYSPYSFLVYAGFFDGAIGIFEADSLTLQCRIAPSAFIPSPMSSGGGIVYPLVVAAHLWNPNQIAVGMSDGTINVLEPLDKDVQVGTDASGRHVASR